MDPCVVAFSTSSTLVMCDLLSGMASPSRPGHPMATWGMTVVYFVIVSGPASTTVYDDVMGAPGRKLAIAGQYRVSDS